MGQLQLVMMKKYTGVGVAVELDNSLPQNILLTLLPIFFVVQHAPQSVPSFASSPTPLGPVVVHLGSNFHLTLAPHGSTLQDGNFLHDQERREGIHAES
jgi:hypothetical protein